MKQDEKALYILVNKLGLEQKKIADIGLNPAFVELAEISKTSDVLSDKEHLIQVAPEIFSKAIIVLQQSDKKYQDKKKLAE